MMLAACHVERLSRVICKEGGWRWSNEVCLSGVCCWMSESITPHWLHLSYDGTDRQTDRDGEIVISLSNI